MLLALAVLTCKTNVLAQVVFKLFRFFPARRRYVSFLLRRRIQPPTGAIDCAVVWPGGEPASAHGHHE